MTKEQAAKAYLVAVGPVNDIGRTFVNKAKGWTDSTPSSRAAADAKPYSDSLTT